jgi:hypothetical protein
MRKFEILDGDWAEELQKGFESYMQDVYESIDVEQEEDSDFETESGLPFCACNVCEVREILFYITPRVIQGYLDKKVNLL